MIGKQDWFQRKDFGSWGLEAVSWQGWVYTVVAIGVFIFIVHAPDTWFFHPGARTTSAVVWALLFVADIVHIWFKLKGKRDLF